MVSIAAQGACCALGGSLNEIAANLSAGRAPGMTEDHTLLQGGVSCFVGRVYAPLPDIPAELAAHNSRNNQLILQCFRQLEPAYHKVCAGLAPDRIGVVLGTSTSGLDEADRMVSTLTHEGHLPASYHYAQQELGDPARFLRAYLKLSGPAYTISTACSSSLRAIIAAVRLLKTGLCDAVLCGGADTLSRMPLNGFNAMELVSQNELCRPFTLGRHGISIGEGAALLLLTNAPGALEIAGTGESSDAYHISSPHPEGAGALQAMCGALAEAGIAPAEVDYLNLHGTGTVMNDLAESRSVQQLLPEVPCSSTKYLTGHTLGACGALETVLCALILERGLNLPPLDLTRAPLDPELAPCAFLQDYTPPRRRCFVMNNAFAFGGNNAALILKYRG